MVLTSPRPTRFAGLRILSRSFALEFRQPPADEIVGTGTGLGTDIPQTNDLPRLLVNKSNLDRPAGVSGYKLQRRPLFSSDLPLVADLRQCLDHENDVHTLARQGILVAIRSRLIQSPIDQAVCLEVLEAVGQCRMRDTGRFVQIVITREPKAKIAQDQHRPTVANGVQNAGN